MVQQENYDRVLDIVVQKDEVTWQSMLMDLVKVEGMNPWDIDVSRISSRYISMLKKLKELDFRVSGKVVLASAILLKLKSQKLLNDDITELDRLMAPPDEMSQDEFYEDLNIVGGIDHGVNDQIPPLMPRTPQPRKRKVSIYDLMSSLQKALEVRDRRVLRAMPSIKMEIPTRNVDISVLIDEVHKHVTDYYDKQSSPLSYHKLVDAMDRDDKIHRFNALLHLANISNRHIDLEQAEHFGEILIHKANPDPEAMGEIKTELAKNKDNDPAESKQVD